MTYTTYYRLYLDIDNRVKMIETQSIFNKQSLAKFKEKSKIFVSWIGEWEEVEVKL